MKLRSALLLYLTVSVGLLFAPVCSGQVRQGLQEGDTFTAVFDIVSPVFPATPPAQLSHKKKDAIAWNRSHAPSFAISVCRGDLPEADASQGYWVYVKREAHPRDGYFSPRNTDEVGRSTDEKYPVYLVDYSVAEDTCRPKLDPVLNLMGCDSRVKAICRIGSAGPRAARNSRDSKDEDSAAPDEGSAGGDAASEIARIRNGGHSAIPSPERSAGSGAVAPEVVIENSTSHTITVYFSGKASRTVSIAPGDSATVRLPSGHYEMAAEAPHTAILPFYGIHNQDDAQYQYRFFVGGR